MRTPETLKLKRKIQDFVLIRTAIVRPETLKLEEAYEEKDSPIERRSDDGDVSCTVREIPRFTNPDDSDGQTRDVELEGGL
jgi:hypothetical protein